MSGIFDTHAHYDDESFDIDRDELLSKLPENGVVGVINCGVDIHSSETCIELSEKYPYFYSAVGYHPENIPENGMFEKDTLIKLLKHKKVVAVGEIGLDYHWRNDNKELQTDFFVRQMEIANETEKPVIIHSRDATEDTLNAVKSVLPRGVMHCFSGSPDTAKIYIDLGFYLGFGGVVTFKNAKKSTEIIKNVPLERLLLETDCPYMTPEPCRGKRNNSAYIKYVAEKIADIKGISYYDVISATYNNAKILFGIE